MIRHRFSSALCLCLTLVLSAGIAGATALTPEPSSPQPTIGLLWSVIGEESGVSVGDGFVLTGRVVDPLASDAVLLPLYVAARRASQLASEQTVTDTAPITEVALAPIWPNPNHGEATIAWALPRSSIVRLTILDVQGRQVAVLANGVYEGGRHNMAWHANRSRGEGGAGIYFVRLVTADRVLNRRMVVAP